MPLESYRDVAPRLGRGVLPVPNAGVVGDVELGDDVSLWFHSVARGDVDSIRQGARTSAQDGAVLHVAHERLGRGHG